MDTGENKLTQELKKKSLEWAREFYKKVPNGSFENSVIWLKGKADREEDIHIKELANMIVGAFIGPNTKGITVGIGQMYGSTVYPENIWRDALKESYNYVRRKSVNIRGLDSDLYLKARAQAISEGKNIGEWLNEIIKAKLQRAGVLK